MYYSFRQILCSIILSLSVLSIGKAQKSLQDFNLTGPVKKIRSTVYTAVNNSGKPVKGEIAEREEAAIGDLILGYYDDDFYEAEFSETGKLTNQRFYTMYIKYVIRDSEVKRIRKEFFREYDSEGRPYKQYRVKESSDSICMTEYKYDDHKHLVEKIEYSDSGDTLKKIEFTYYSNDTARTREEITFREGKRDYAYLNSYSEKGIQTGRFSILASGKKDSTSEYTYDKRGNLICDYKSYPLISKDLKFEYFYDKYNNHIKTISVEDENTSYLRELFRYDTKGRLTEENIYNVIGELYYRKTYKYDKQGNKIEDLYYDKTGTLKIKEIKDYDQYGSVIKEIYSNAFEESNKTTTVDYTYDSYKNPVQKIISVNGTASYIIELIIEYY